jgi:polysaccharide biosynthesis protein PslE
MASTCATGASGANRPWFLLRHKWKALALFVTIMGAAVAVTALSSRTYRSEAKLFVRLGRENATVDPTATLGRDPIVAVPVTRDNEINSVVEILGSRVLLDKVVDAIGPDAILGYSAATPSGATLASSSDWRGWLERMNLATPLGDRDRAIAWLAKRLSVRPVRKSEVVVVSCDAPSPELAQRVVSRLVEYYLDEHGRWNRTTGAHDFFAQQTSAARNRLAQAEEQLREVKNRTGIIAPESQRQLLSARISRLEEESSQNATAVAAAEARIARHREILSSEPATAVASQTEGYPDQGTDLMREQLYVLQMQEQAATVKYTEEHPLRQQIHDQAVASQAILGQEGRSRIQTMIAPNKRREQAELALAAEGPSLAALRAEGASRQAELVRLRGELAAFNAHDLEVARLQREVDLCAGSYRKYAESLEQARIDEALEDQRISNISVVQPATFDALPVRPKVAMNLLLGLAAALSGAVGAAYWADGRRRRGAAQPASVPRPSAVRHQPSALSHPR